MPRRLTLPAAFGLVLLAGCGGTPAGGLPADPDQLVVYSLDGPAHFKSEGELTPEQAKGEVLHGYPVLGKVDVADPARRREVVAAVAAAVRGAGTQAKCFNPRHAVRTVAAGVTVDVVICFECGNYQGYRNGTRAPGPTPGISSAANPLLDQLLTDAGVSLAPKD